MYKGVRRTLELRMRALHGKTLKPTAAQLFRVTKTLQYQKPTHLPGTQDFHSPAEDRLDGKRTVTTLTGMASLKMYLFSTPLYTRPS